MNKERIASPTAAAQERRDAELFIHLRLGTVKAAPLLASADVAQAAQTALGSRVRQHRCRVMALGCGPDHLHAVLQFPPSLSLRHLVLAAREAGAQAVAQALSVEDGTGVAPEAVWAPAYQLDTLSAGDVADIAEYLRQHPDMPERADWERADLDGEFGLRPAWLQFIREAQGRYNHAPDTPLP